MTRQDRRERYAAIVRVVAYNTGGPDTQLPAGVRYATIAANRAHCGEAPDDVQSALQAAVANDDLVRYRDRDGHTRYACRTVAGLRDLVAAESQREHPDRDQIAECNRIIQELREGDE